MTGAVATATGAVSDGRASPRPAAWRRWAGRGVWAVLDQGFFALSSLALNLLLARWLPQREYGAFALAFSLFLLFGTVYSAFVPEPLLVFGPSRFHGDFARYLRVLLTGHVLVTGAGSAAFALAAAVLWGRGDAVMAASFAAWAVAAPCVTLSWLLRRACFARSVPEVAAAGGAAQLLLTVGALAVLWEAGALTLLRAVLATAAVNLVTSAGIFVRLRRTAGAADGSVGAAGGVLTLHWRYGRWAAAGGLLAWACTYSYYLLLPRWGGLEATAALRALYTLGIPVAHAQSALATVLIPSLVRARGTRRFGRLLRLAAAGFGVASVTGWLVLGVVGRPLIHAAYGGRYDAYAALIWAVAAVPVTAGACDLLRSALRAQERPDAVFRGYGLAALTTATLGVALTFRLGVLGPMLGEVASNVVAAGVMAVALARGRAAGAPGATP